MIYPLKVILCDPKRATWPSRKCTVETTGLGGGDLPFPDKAQIVVRTDRHKQNIYGPSMTVETFTDCYLFGTAAIPALGFSKAAHEFLVLHYFATDSIVYWHAFLRELQLPDAFVRRIEVFFLSECCMAQRRSLSGRSPFCQRKLNEKSQIRWKNFSTKATNWKQTSKKHQPRCSLPESAGTWGVACSSDG